MSTAVVLYEPAVCTAAPIAGTAIAPYVGVISYHLTAHTRTCMVAFVAATGPGLEALVENLVHVIAADSGVDLHGLFESKANYLDDGFYNLVIRNLNA